jgi:hypothetical protein
MSTIGGTILVDTRGAQGARGATGTPGTGANPFPAIAGETSVLNEAYEPGDIRRYGIEPDDGIDHGSVNPTRVTGWTESSTLPGVTARAVQGTYSFQFDVDATLSGSRIHFENAHFTGLVHITGGASDIHWSGEFSVDDRLGITGEGSTKVRLGIVHARGASRCIHLVGCPDLEFELLHVENTDTCDVAGDQGNLAAVFIENQADSVVRGRILVENSQTNGVFVNALDGDLVIDVRGYGNTAIDAGANALEGLSTAQTETGFGVCLPRYQGRARIRIDQSNASPAADTYTLWIPETGTSAVTASRHKPVNIDGLDVTVGDGNRGVVIGPDGGSFTTCNVLFSGDCSIVLRSGDSLASGYAGITVTPPPVGDNCYVRAESSSRIGMTGFGAVKVFKATAVAATADDNNYTMLGLKLHLPDIAGSSTTPNVELDGTGGFLWGSLDLGAVHCTSGSSFTSALVSVTAATDLHVKAASITGAANTNSTAVALAGSTNCTFGFPQIYGFYRNPDGAVAITGTHTGSKFNGGELTHGNGSTLGYGLRLGGTSAGCEFNGWRPNNFDNGFKANTPTFTNSTARGMISPADGAGNDDATDLTTAQFPAANQLGCVNFAV